MPDAHVAWADYDALRRRAGAKRCNELIDKLILDELSFISESQLVNNDANFSIATGKRTCLVNRPPDYGRAALFQSSFGLLDVKGIGVAPDRAPSLGQYSTGLPDLPEAVI